MIIFAVQQTDIKISVLVFDFSLSFLSLRQRFLFHQEVSSLCLKLGPPWAAYLVKQCIYGSHWVSIMAI